MLALEKAEESGAVPVHVDVQVVLDGRDPAYDPLAVSRKEELDRAVLMERMTRGIDELMDITAQWRDPVRIIPVKPEWKLDELAPIPLRPDRLDANVPCGRNQIRSISRPTR
ncbi:MAG: hypothetical protein ABI681_12360 [Gemmatimonadales bacterium]